MADVPFATNLLGAIAPYIAQAPGAMVPGQAIGNLPDAYWAGQNQQYQQRQRDLFAGQNLPRDAAGNIDFRRAAEMALQAGGAPAINNAIALGDYDVEKRALERNQGTGYGGVDGGQTPPATAIAPPSSGTATPAPAATIPSSWSGGVVPSSPTVVGDAEGVQRGLYDAPAAPGARPPAQPVGGGTGFQPPAAPAATPGMPTGARIAQGFEDAGPAFQAQRQQLEAQARDYENAAAENFRLGAILSKNNPGAGARYQAMGEAAAKRAQSSRDALNKMDELSPPQHDYALAQRQGYKGTFKEYQAEEQASKAETAADVAELGKLKVAGIAAKGKLEQLNTIKQLGENVGYGAIPKVQSFLGRYGIETRGLTDIQAYERAIDYLAPSLRPEGSGRLMQTELAAFKSSLGGLLTTPEGRRIAVENLKLIHEYSANVGEVAADTKLSPSQRIQKIYALPAIGLSTLWEGPTGARYIVKGNKIVGRAQ